MAKATDSPEPILEHPYVPSEDHHHHDEETLPAAAAPHHSTLAHYQPAPQHQHSYSQQYAPPPEPPRPEPGFQFMHDASFRNLFLGFFCIFVALMLFCGAWVLLGPQALIPFITSILVLLLLSSIWAFGIHRQSGGLFLSLGLVTIVGALIPLLIGVVLNLPAGQAYLAHLKTLPANSQGGYPGTGGPVQVTASQQTPLLSDAFGIFPTVGSQAEQVKIVSDSRVELEGKVYLMRAGQIFPVHSRSEDGVVIRAKDYLVTLSREMVDFVSPTPVTVASNSTPAAAPTPAATPQVDRAAVTKKAQDEAVRRYPALGIQDSDENRIFVDAYTDFKQNRPEFFDDPSWPLTLANQLGTAYGWQDITQPSSKKPVAPDMGMDIPPMPTAEEDSFQSDTLYLKETEDGVPGATKTEEVVDELMIDNKGGEAEIQGEVDIKSDTVDLDSAPPLEIPPDR